MLGCLEYPYFIVNPFHLVLTRGKEVFSLNASFEMPKVQTMEMLGCLEYPYFGVNPFQLVFTRVLGKEVFKLNVSFEMPKVKNAFVRFFTFLIGSISKCTID